MCFYLVAGGAGGGGGIGSSQTTHWSTPFLWHSKGVSGDTDSTHGFFGEQYSFDAQGGLHREMHTPSTHRKLSLHAGTHDFAFVLSLEGSAEPVGETEFFSWWHPTVVVASMTIRIVNRVRLNLAPSRIIYTARPFWSPPRS